MYKNQLQELAQRSCFNLPSYSCIREGPDHAPRFKATVTFNGEVFESPGYYSTLRQAEHAAAEVALNSLSKRGPTQSLAARILDETGVCKNLLQETAQRAGVSLPVYTTIRSGPKHLPLFKCVVHVGGRNFVGEPAKTKKQAEKNAAMAAWSALKQMSSTSQTPQLHDSCESEDTAGDRSSVGSKFGREDRGKFLNSSLQVQCGSARPRSRTVNSRDINRTLRDGYSSSGKFYSGTPAASGSDSLNHERNHNGFLISQRSPAPGEVSYEDGQRHMYNPTAHAGSSQILPDSSFGGGRGFYKHAATPGSYGGSSRRQKGRHQRRHSLSGMESPMATHETATTSRASGGGSILGRMMVYHPQQIRGLPYQSLSERFELNRPSLLEELQQRDEEEEWHRGGDSLSSSVQTQQLPRNRWQSQSERFEYRNYHLPQLEEISGKDEDEWHQIEPIQSSNSNAQRAESSDCDRNYNEGWPIQCSNSNVQRAVSSDCNRNYNEGWPIQSSNSNAQRALSSDCNRNYTEGWLRGETLLRRLEDNKRHGYKEGWLLGDVVKDDKKTSSREGWAHNEPHNTNLEEERIQTLNPTRGQTHIHGYNDGWLQAEALGSSSEERTPAHGLTYNYQSEKKSAYNSAVSSSTVASGSPSHSNFSSLWSKSTQWWGSRSPLSPSSAAAALANSLGLRPAASMAPAVRVRHMVPVFAAPPPRGNEVPGPIQPPRSDQALPMIDGESTTRHLFSKLRL